MTKNELVKLEIEKRSYAEVLKQFKIWYGNRVDGHHPHYTVFEMIPGYEGWDRGNKVESFLASIVKKMKKIQQIIDENYDSTTD